MKKTFLNFLIIFVFILNFKSVAYTQEASSQVSDIEEIVVTSQKRANAIAAQDLPVSVTAINEDLIIRSDSLDLTDVGRMVPNATLHPSATFAGTPNFLIRGIGVSGTTRSLDPTVGIIVDGVYLGFPVGANLDMFDRESVEILRGPQGTLIGRNVTGGAIVVRSKRPSGNFGAKIDATIGDYNRKDFSASIEGPFSDTVSGKIAFMSRDRDGYWKDNNGGTMIPTAGAIARGYDETGTGESGTKPDVDLTIIKPMILIEPNENLDITFIAEFLTDKSGTANSRNFVNKVCFLCDADVNINFRLHLNNTFNNTPANISVFRRACHTLEILRDKKISLIKGIWGRSVGKPGPVALTLINLDCIGSRAIIVDVTPLSLILKLGTITKGSFFLANYYLL